MIRTILGWFTGLEAQGKAVAILIGIGLAVIATVTAVHFINAAFEIAEDKGAAVERAEAQGKVIENATKAKAAAESVLRDGGPSRDECLRDSRTRENC